MQEEMSQPSRLLLFAIFCALLVGCMRLPEEDPCSLRWLAPSLEETVALARAQDPFAVGDFPDARWWQQFEDEQLSLFIEQALSNEPNLKNAEARVKTAQDEADMQRASLLPTIGLSAQGAQQYFGKNGFFRAYAPTFPGRINEYFLELNFDYEFDFWGKFRNLFRAALGEARAKEAESAQVAIVLSSSVAFTYYSWQIEKRRLRLLEEQEELASLRTQLTSSRQSDALDNRQQTLQASTAQLQLGKQIAESKQTLRLLETQLKLLLGVGPDDPIHLQVHALPADAKIALPEHLSSNLLARRPDLMALIWRVEAAAERVGAARADFYPSINLAALIGLDSVFINKFFTWPSRTAKAIPALNLPIFTGGFLRAQLKARQSEFVEASMAYNQQLLQAVKEVADQIAMVQTADERLRMQTQIVQQTAQTHLLTEMKNRHAISSYLEVIDTKQALIDQQQLELAEQLQKLSTTVSLIKALGGGYCSL